MTEASDSRKTPPGKLSVDFPRCPQCKPGLAAAASTGEGHQPHVFAPKELLHVRQFLLAPDKGSAWGRKRRRKADSHISQAWRIMVEILIHTMIFGRSSPKNGFVTTPGHFNNQWIDLTFECVVLPEFRAQAPDLNPDNIVYPGIERLSTVEDLDTERVFIERRPIALQLPLDQVPEEPAQAGGVGESRASQNPP